jgi:hypothetical protein
VWLAQCGASNGDDGNDVALLSSIDSRAIHALPYARPRHLSYPSEEELPTLGLVNLLDELLIVRGHWLDHATAELLLLLLVHRLPNT